MKRFKNWKPAEKAGAVVYAAIALLLFYSYYYADFYETGLEGVRFWDILFSGQIHHFYTQIFLIGKVQYIPLYDFPMYIVFAIWNFPLWVVQKVSGINIYHSVPCLMWMKSMLLFWLCMFLWQFGKLIPEMAGAGENKGQASVSGQAKVLQKSGAAPLESPAEGVGNSVREGQFLFLTSAFFMTGLVVLGQYDIISMTFMMIGLRYYLEGNTKKFVLWFAIAAPFKYFAILIFVPLLLLQEKRISSIILRGIGVVIPILFFRVAVPFGRPDLVEGCTFSGSSSGSNVAKPVFDALYVRGAVGFGTLFIYIFVWVVFLVLCYMYRPGGSDAESSLSASGKTDRQRTGKADGSVRGENMQAKELQDPARITAYTCYLAFMIQFTFGYSHPYWLILMVPFMVLMILQNEELRYVNLLLETMACGAMTFAQIMYYDWCFDSNIVNLSFWKNILPGGVTGMTDWYGVIQVLSQYIKDDRMQNYASGAGLSVYAACILIFTVINFPLWKRKLPIVAREKREYRWLLPLRALLTVLLGLVPLGLYFYRALVL